MRCTTAVRRISGVVHARALFNRARVPLEWAALEASPLACAWRWSPRSLLRCALDIKERASQRVPARVFLHVHCTELPVFVTAAARICSAAFCLCFCSVLLFSSLPLFRRISAPASSALLARCVRLQHKYTEYEHRRQSSGNEGHVPFCC